MSKISIKRAYDPAEPADGFRVYIDRLWPRGLSHDEFHYDLWVKDIAPSTELREWFHADSTDRWDEFVTRYAAELKASTSFADFKQQIAGHPVVTLLYSSHDREHNNAVVVRQLLDVR
ncbi:MAG: DUF488 family protein [Muribaculaceae bacterium]|nr:DUF488 family protein [Muribaculaceae bacterium]